MEVWRCAAGVASLPQELYCLLLLEFLVFVPQGSLLPSGLRRPWLIIPLRCQPPGVIRGTPLTLAG